ncbi:MAG: hypothetical protein QNJ68_10865 [Microcoleaceae cyanobacterium MO_207.B10]|nr:hypothetical protein [Microcoleaceae cyanobacterium MO_207.B10]
MDDLKNHDSLDRSLEKALTNQLIDRYFDHTESWLRAILRKCIFSLAHLNGQTIFLIECPNLAVAKRLSRKTYPFLWFADHFSHFNSGKVLVCYLDRDQNWQCYDSDRKLWGSLNQFNASSATTDD